MANNNHIIKQFKHILIHLDSRGCLFCLFDQTPSTLHHSCGPTVYIFWSWFSIFPDWICTKYWFSLLVGDLESFDSAKFSLVFCFACLIGTICYSSVWFRVLWLCAISDFWLCAISVYRLCTVSVFWLCTVICLWWSTILQADSCRAKPLCTYLIASQWL